MNTKSTHENYSPVDLTTQVLQKLRVRRKLYIDNVLDHIRNTNVVLDLESSSG